MPVWPSERLARLHELWPTGMEIHLIARELGVSAGAVIKQVKTHRRRALAEGDEEGKRLWASRIVYWNDGRRAQPRNHQKRNRHRGSRRQGLGAYHRLKKNCRLADAE